MNHQVVYIASAYHLYSNEDLVEGSPVASLVQSININKMHFNGGTEGERIQQRPCIVYADEKLKMNNENST